MVHGVAKYAAKCATKCAAAMAAAVAAGALFFAAAGCGPGSENGGGERAGGNAGTGTDARAGSAAGSRTGVVARPLTVVVTVPPLAELVRRLAPPDATVSILIPPGRSEHGYEMTPSEMMTLGAADVVFYVGLGLEAQVEGFLKDHPAPAEGVHSRQVVCFADAVNVHVDAHGDVHDHDDAEGHDHEHADAQDANDDGHHHGPIDPHLWLDPELVKAVVPVLDRAMSRAMQSGAAKDSATQSGATQSTQPGEQSLSPAAIKLIEEIDALDRELRERLAPLAGRTIVTHHAAWGRFAARYGLKVAAVIRPVEGAEPTPGQVAAAVEAIRSQHAAAIFIEPQFSPVMAKRIADVAGVKVGTLDPLGSGEWFSLMRANADSVVKTLGP